jgi:hypothetical protein
MGQRDRITVDGGEAPYVAYVVFGEGALHSLPAFGPSIEIDADFELKHGLD